MPHQKIAYRNILDGVAYLFDIKINILIRAGVKIGAAAQNNVFSFAHEKFQKLASGFVAGKMAVRNLIDGIRNCQNSLEHSFRANLLQSLC